jgi:hypothetical protein
MIKAIIATQALAKAAATAKTGYVIAWPHRKNWWEIQRLKTILKITITFPIFICLY